MDIYGYQNMYQYNQSDEIAKQMLARQALPPQLSDQNVAEPHMLPAPSGAPWNVQGLPWGMPSPPQLVQFTAQPPTIEQKYTPVVHCKRKSLDVEPVIPAKQLITEEKMAAHLNSMHISSEYTPYSLSTDNDMMDVAMEPSTSAAANITEKFKGHTIVLSEEVKKLTEEPLLPPSIIERLEKPRMSLVVWKPRENILEKLTEENKEDEEPRRNGVLVTEHMGIQDVEM